MAAVFALLMLALTAVALSIVLDKDAGEMLPFTVFSIILYLYFFYCVNLFRVGTMLLFPVLGAFLVYAAVRAVQGKISLKKKLTPAFAVFCCTSAFFLLYTADNYSINWDELRVWSAIPKAIYETKELQLGTGALVFDTPGYNMQTYPPALPLFANYFLAAARTFAESYIFLAYAVFVSAITVSPFRNLTWKQWYLLPFAFIFVTCAPFVLTLHGGDYSYFYEALFIDPVLGFAAGYVFYLATSKPFESRFSIIRFALALGVLVIIKDSAIMFALLSVLFALCIRRAEEKTSLTALLRDVLLPAGLMCLCYFVWKGLLSYFGSSNHISFHIAIPTLESAGALPQVLLRAPIIQLIVAEFSFAVYAVILLLVCALAEIFLKPHTKANNLCAFLLVAASFLFFSYGYITIFPRAGYELILGLSYYRYFTTLTAAYLTFAFLRYFPAVCGAILTERKVLNRAVFAVCLLLCAFSTYVLFYWESDYNNMYSDFLVRARNEKPEILQEIPVDPAQEHKRVYLLMAEKEPNIFHHRFYFELIGSGINIENFCDDTDMSFGYDPSPLPVEDIAEQWYARLQRDGYDYIYVYSTCDAFDQAFAHLGLGEAVAGQAYAVKK